MQAAADEHADDVDLASLNEVVEDAPIVKFVNLLITQAAQDRASDIHVEPTEHDLRIRFRIDGVLHEVMRSPRSIQAGVISRLKVMADINIAERRIPQDGRISMKVGGRGIDLRVATLPTVYGEKIVMRILDKGQALLRLEDLGFLPETLGALRGLVPQAVRHDPRDRTDRFREVDDAVRDAQPAERARPQHHHGRGPGRVPAAGHQPGAGPPEGRAHVRVGACGRSCVPTPTSCSSVRSVTARPRSSRSRPRSPVTSCSRRCTPTTPRRRRMRLVEMGVEPFLVTSALDCVVAQRLARRLCDKCKEPYEPTEAELVARPAGRSRSSTGSEWPTLYRAIGCPSCGRTGYRGRFALHEVMPITEEIERLIIERRSTEDIQKVAIMQGMLPLRDDGLRKVGMGQTCLEEIFRVVA